ncbi:MAG TPA: helix-turn-helix transcriptional regulator [Clostridia bacterium]|nr:helix-turn-helix transcriptional regulator [Clostridia bacterium]
MLTQKLKDALIKREMSLSKIAERAKVASSTLQNWLYCDGIPTADKAERVLRVLGYKVEVVRV